MKEEINSYIKYGEARIRAWLEQMTIYGVFLALMAFTANFFFNTPKENRDGLFWAFIIFVSLYGLFLLVIGIIVIIERQKVLSIYRYTISQQKS